MGAPESEARSLYVYLDEGMSVKVMDLEVLVAFWDVRSSQSV